MMSWNGLIPHFAANPVRKPRTATILAVAVGGVLGSLARVFLPWPTLLGEHLGPVEPLPTAVVNLIGAALLGFVTGYSKYQQWPEPLSKGVTTGLLGSFTTMSALAVVYTGLTLGQAVFAAGSTVDGLLFGVGILVILAGFLLFTTLITMGSLKLGRRLAKGS